MESLEQENSIDLAGTSWILTALKGGGLLPGTMITLNFVAAGRAAGSSGCNNYTASYTCDGDAIRFGRMAGTLMACPEPLMAQEQAYLQALADAAAFRAGGQSLRLLDGQGAVLAHFDFVSQELAGTKWTVTGYNNGKGGVVSVIIGTELSAQFDLEGHLSGSSGCNTYRGSFEAEEGAISIGPLAGTRKMCFGEGVMEQEAQFLAAMESAATYTISGNRLELRRADGALAVDLRR